MFRHILPNARRLCSWRRRWRCRCDSTEAGLSYLGLGVLRLLPLGEYAQRGPVDLYFGELLVAWLPPGVNFRSVLAINFGVMVCAMRSIRVQAWTDRGRPS